MQKVERGGTEGACGQLRAIGCGDGGKISNIYFVDFSWFDV